MSQENRGTTDELARVDNLLARLRKMLADMYHDRRYSSDDDFVKATEKLYISVQALSSKLTNLETDYFKLQGTEFSGELDRAALCTDKLQTALESAQTGVEIIGAVEQIAKVIHLWL